jgi:hypothetical protein
LGGIGKFADPDTIEDDQNDAMNGVGPQALALVCRVVITYRPRRPDGRNGVLEDHVVGTGMLDDHCEAIEVLDPSLELGAIHEPHQYGKLFTSSVIEEDVLNVRLGR